MLTNGCRPNHRSLLPMRRGFTLIELILVVLIMLILLTLTVAVVGNVLDNDRVRGASRQVKNYLAGARDRAIYSASRVEIGSGETPPRVGVRYLANPALMVPDPVTGRPIYRGFSSMVFVQENRPMDGSIRIFEDPVGSGDWFVSQLMPDNTTPVPGVGSTAIRSLIDRGLVETRWEYDPATDSFQEFFYLPLTFPARDTSLKKFYVRFLDSSPYIQGDYLLKAPLSAPLPGTPPVATVPETATVHMLPSPLPSEEPRLLPDGTIIEVQSSVVGSGPKHAGSLPMNVSLKNLARADGSFDIMFNAQGVVDGPIAAAGLVHLVIADLQDIERGFGVVIPYEDTSTTPSTHFLFTGSPFLDTNDDISDGVDPVIEEGKSVERQGDVRIVSIRTQTGGTSIAPIDPSFDSSTNRFVDPFRFAETGEEAP